MKTLSTREFVHGPAVIKSLRPGQSLLLTDNGKPSAVLTKPGKRPHRSLADLQREARAISPRAGRKVNFTQAAKEMEGR